MNNLFTFFLQRNFQELEGYTYCFLLLLCFEIFALLLSFCTNIAFDFLHVLLRGMWNKLKESFGRLGEKTKTQALLEFICVKPLRLKKKQADFENVCVKPLRLKKKQADLENVCTEPLHLMKKQAELKIVCTKPLRLMKKQAELKIVCAKPLRLIRTQANLENCCGESLRLTKQKIRWME